MNATDSEFITIHPSEEKEWHRLFVHQRAVETLQACERQADSVLENWLYLAGETGRAEYKKLALETMQTYAAQSTRLFLNSFGGKSAITRDGDLSLYVRTPSIVFGMIFHRAHRPDVALPEDYTVGHGNAPMLGRYCAHQDGGTETLCLKPVERGDCSEHGTVERAYSIAVPGTWGFHS